MKIWREREREMKIWRERERDEKRVDENIRISCHNFCMEIIFQLIMETE